MKIPLTILILTLNEEAMIARALQSACAIAEEVLIVDSFSDDKTLSIAQTFPCRILQHSFEGFAKQWNYGIAQAKFDWVFILCADEYLTPQLQCSLCSLISGEPKHAIYLCYLTNMLWDKPAGRPDPKLRLLNRAAGIRYKDKQVHEVLETSGYSVGKLEGRLMHKPEISLSFMVEKANQYTSLEVADFLTAGKKFPLARLILYPFYHFFKEYFREGRCREGLRGFVYSLFAMHYQVIKYAKIIEHSRRWTNQVYNNSQYRR
jgi:glycosyltransferase involved in cell wall biosynthesis